LLDLGDVALRFRLPRRVHWFLNFVFQFKIKLNAEILAPGALDLFGLFEIGPYRSPYR
jgi:hypothetical protein